MKRYRYFNCAGFQGIDEASDGDYVAYDDAKQLEQDNVQQAQTIKELQSQLQAKTEECDGLRAQVNELRDTMYYYSDPSNWWGDGSGYYRTLAVNMHGNTKANMCLEKTPAQSLSAIRNEAIREGWDMCMKAVMQVDAHAYGDEKIGLDYDEIRYLPYPQLTEDE